MKKLLIFPLLVLLTSCVTYYYPETALEDGVYYAEDDPSYNVYQGYYPGYAYYPWSTLDYFYMGYHPYPIYAHYYGYPYRFGFGYSPWHYPFGHYGYYSPLYASHYHYPRYPAWYPYSGYCLGYNRCDRGHRNRDVNGEKRLVGKGKNSRRKLADSDVGDNEIAADQFENPNAQLNTGAIPNRRYVSTMPPGYSGNQGMVIRSSDSKKIGKSGIQPVNSTSTSNGIVIAAPPSQTALTSGSNPASQPSAPAASTRSHSTRSSSGNTRSRSSSAPRMSSGSSSRARSSTRSSSRTSKSSTPSTRKRD